MIHGDCEGENRRARAVFIPTLFGVTAVPINKLVMVTPSSTPKEDTTIENIIEQRDNTI